MCFSSENEIIKEENGENRKINCSILKRDKKNINIRIHFSYFKKYDTFFNFKYF